MNFNRSTFSTKFVSILIASSIASASFAGEMRVSIQPEGSVLKVKLDDRLDSRQAKVGDKFTATVDMGKRKDYFGLPSGTKVEGHVSNVQSRQGKTPGLLALQADTIILTDGTRYPIEASTMRIDRRSVRTEGGRLMASPAYRHGSTNFVATGAAVGVVAAALTGSDLLAGGILGAAIGYLIGQSNGSTSAHDITLKPGTTFGVRFDRDTPISID